MPPKKPAAKKSTEIKSVNLPPETAAALPPATPAPVVHAPAAPAVVSAGDPSAPRPTIIVPRPVTSMPRFAGRVESWEPGIVTGWAIDRSRPDQPLDLGLYDGDELLLRFAAGLPRPDLTGPGFGNGRHGFRQTFPQALLVRERHLFRVKLIELGHDLPGSPYVYRQSLPILDMDSFTAVAADLRERLAATTEFATARDAVGMLFGLLGEALPKFQALRAKAPAPVEHAIDLAQSFAPRIAAMLTQLRDRYPAATLPMSNQPVVSVIVPAFEHFDRTYTCLCSIAANPPALPYEVIVVDDGSLDETVFLTTIVTGVRMHRLPHHVGAVASRNAGAALARGAFLLFLDNGTEVRPGWLDELHAVFAADSLAGMAGSKLVGPDGSVLEAGGIIGPLGDRVRVGNGWAAEHPGASYRREVDDCSGASMMVPADLFRDLGGFDAAYTPGYGEDTDLALRIHKAGRRVYCQPLSVVVGHDAASPPKAAPGANTRRLFDRWRATLASHRQDQDRFVTGHALVISGITPTAEAAADIVLLRKLGLHVAFVPAATMKNAGDATNALQRAGIECLYEPFYGSVEDVLRQRGNDCDLIVLHGAGIVRTYLAMARMYATKAKVLLRTADTQIIAGVDASFQPTIIEAALRDLLRTQGLPLAERSHQTA